MQSFRIFSGDELDKELQNSLVTINNEICNQSDDYILNINENEFINSLVNKHKFTTIEIQFEGISVSTYEKMISANDFPSSFRAIRVGARYPRDVIKYHLPFVGNSILLHFQTNPFTTWSPIVTVEDSCICFEIVNFHNDSESIKREAESNVQSIKTLSEFANNQVNQHNQNLQSHIQGLFTKRKNHLLQKRDLVASLGVPIKKRENVSNTFAIPTPAIRKEIQVPLTVPSEKGYQPEPTLEKATYQSILKIIQDVGKQFERMPSTYYDKSEEELRDHLLLVLEPNFEGTATGETFNKTGKTDILLRYDGKNVFIAECKFWTGEKGFIETISQLLRYLSWRDSKAAVIMFVKNKEFSSVIRTVEEITPTHLNYLGFEEKKDDSWLSYRFHINGDRNREVKLAIMLFHIPSSKKRQ